MPQPISAQPISAITGEDLGDRTLGRMSDWTVSVVNPGATFPLSNSHVVFATTQNPRLREAIAQWNHVYAHTNTSPLDKLLAAAALCLTSPPN